MVKFRRNYTTPLRGGSLRRRAILLTFVVVSMIFMMVYFSTNFVKPVTPKPLVVEVEFLAQKKYRIHKDTTNYEEFASILKKNIQNFKKRSDWVEILVNLPGDQSAGQVADIVQVSNAFKGVKMRLKTER